MQEKCCMFNLAVEQRTWRKRILRLPALYFSDYFLLYRTKLHLQEPGK